MRWPSVILVSCAAAACNAAAGLGDLQGVSSMVIGVPTLVPSVCPTTGGEPIGDVASTVAVTVCCTPVVL